MHDNESRLHYIPSFIGRLLHRKLGLFPPNSNLGRASALPTLQKVAPRGMTGRGRF